MEKAGRQGNSLETRELAECRVRASDAMPAAYVRRSSVPTSSMAHWGAAA